MTGRKLQSFCCPGLGLIWVFCGYSWVQSGLTAAEMGRTCGLSSFSFSYDPQWHCPDHSRSQQVTDTDIGGGLCATLWLYMRASERETGAMRRKSPGKSSPKWNIKEKKTPYHDLHTASSKDLSVLIATRSYSPLFSLRRLKPSPLEWKGLREGRAPHHKNKH